MGINQVYIPIGFSGLFPHATYNLTADIEQCRQKFGITLRPNWYAIFVRVSHASAHVHDIPPQQ
jgi:hypothetical protein